ncbi:MAG: hypothetical protein WCQ67_07805 [Treponema sp.]
MNMSEEEMNEVVNSIRSKYDKKSTRQEKVEEIENLDQSVTSAGTVWALVYGIIGALIFGTGMCCVIIWNRMVFGIIIGLLGMIIMSLAIPGRKLAMERQKAKVSGQIKKLSEEVLE